ncbi:uncharacterized protein LOC129757780 [Uranotaenia lowii]|uniref:uncharacterized protein LOC129757780 n=1 Tax=Uranotaenia lowii TaxID=190385 RepID=UPI00247A9D06|nr:uncharacterized protein LOC129757780 [Uranotaenia lowii]
MPSSSGSLLVALAILLSLVIETAYCLKCVYCKSDLYEEACDAVGKQITCNEENAEEHFRYLQRLDKSLEMPRRNEGYQCMKIKVGNHRLVKGCIYANLNVCLEFRKRAKPCSTCMDNECNSLKYRDYYLN